MLSLANFAYDSALKSVVHEPSEKDMTVTVSIEFVNEDGDEEVLEIRGAPSSTTIPPVSFFSDGIPFAVDNCANQHVCCVKGVVHV